MTTLTQINKSDILDFTRELRQKNPDLCFLADAIVEAIENKSESDRIIASQDQMIADLRKKNKKRKKKIKKMEAVTSDLIVKINDMQETLDDLASQMQE